MSDQEKTLALIDQALTKLRLSETLDEKGKATHELVKLLQTIQTEAVMALVVSRRRRPEDRLPR